MVPEYEDFYRELLADKTASFEDKLTALQNFIESEVINQELEVDTAKIVQVKVC